MKTLHPVHINSIDELTKLMNRKKLLSDLLDNEFKIVFLMNIDDFSSINTVYGLDAGDTVLENIGCRLLGVLNDMNEECYAYRIAGDEFAIVFFNELPNIRKIKLLSKMFISELTQNIELSDNKNIAINITSGIAFGKDDVLLKAEIALKVAKKNNLHVTIFKESFNTLSRKKRRNMKDLVRYKEALIKGEIIVYYQPIVCNKTDKRVKYEALSRIKHNYEIISPYYFIPLSKQLKMYNNISISIVKKSIEDFIGRDEMVSINISIEDVYNKMFITEILNLAHKYKLLNNVIFEITESSKIKDYAVINDFIKKLEPFGINISLDDFGTEYSNFEHISKIETNYLKIDGTFIHDIEHNEKNYKLVESIVKLCKELGIKTVAEYVSNGEIHKLVKKIGVDYSQGFYFGEAMPIEKIKGLNNEN